jgi:aspartyl-tRNA synthetase
MYRSHTCGELRPTHIGETVKLAGWVAKNRGLGEISFVDLRDRYGITQLAFNMKTNEALCTLANSLGREYVIQAEGNVAERSSKNMNIPTGEIEIVVTKLEIISKSETPPFTIENDTDGGEELRMKYRYLDIRRPILKERLEVRAKVAKATRAYLDDHLFTEIETPFFIKSTPEGARDFLVPSRMNKGSFYALPQSPQILKQLLMVAGMDRYYQIVKCFRDEDFRGDRQPEFTQIDCEMSFVEQEDVLQMFEGMTKHVYKEVKGIDIPTFQRLTYHDAMKTYGSDKPDLRFDCKIVELNDTLPSSEFIVFNNAIASNGLVAGLNAKACAEYTRKQIDELTEFVKVPNRGMGGLMWIRYTKEGYKSSMDKFYTPEQLAVIGASMGAEEGDLLLIVADKTSKVRKALGDMRGELAKRNNWIKENTWSVLWVVDFPLFERDEETNEIIFMHHPFVMPYPEDVQYLATDPTKVRGQLYDLVINGNEIVSGSIRIHQRELQEQIFNILGLSEEDIESKFGFMVNAFKYGAPPHGGCAFGLDRWVMLLTGGDTIRDVIAFPKNNAGRDTMMEAPSGVDLGQLKDLGIVISN